MPTRGRTAIIALLLPVVLGSTVASADADPTGRYAIPATGDPQPVSDPLSVYPEELEESRIRCEQFVPNSAVPVPNHVPQPGEPGHLARRALCDQTARDFYQEIRFQITTLTSTDPNVVAQGLAVIGPGSTFLFPDGTFTVGTGFEAGPPPAETGLVANVDNLFGHPPGVPAPPVVRSIENRFFYKPIDMHTVLFVGAPLFTVEDVDGTTRTIRSIQTSVYRKVANRPDGSADDSNCRSPSNPGGDVCWVDLHEQWVYGQPALGD